MITGCRWYGCDVDIPEIPGGRFVIHSDGLEERALPKGLVFEGEGVRCEFEGSTSYKTCAVGVEVCVDECDSLLNACDDVRGFASVLYENRFALQPEDLLSIWSAEEKGVERVTSRRGVRIKSGDAEMFDKVLGFKYKWIWESLHHLNADGIFCEECNSKTDISGGQEDEELEEEIFKASSNLARKIVTAISASPILPFIVELHDGNRHVRFVIREELARPRFLRTAKGCELGFVLVGGLLRSRGSHCTTISCKSSDLDLFMNQSGPEVTLKLE